MLPAANRLRRSSDFAAAMRGGRRVGRGTLVVHLASDIAKQPGSSLPGCLPSAEPGDVIALVSESELIKAGFVVSKAVGNAVVRNRVKRRLRHLVAAHQTELPPGSTIVVRALPAAAGAAYQTLELDLTSALAAARKPRKPSGGAR
jgi:ribonuclease P protein component